MKCCLIQDLLPLYCEKLTSEESNAEIEQHLLNCTVCNQIYENMLVTEEPKIPVPADIQPLKKVRKRNRIKIGISIFSTTFAMLALFYLLFWGIIPASSGRIEITGSVEKGNFLITDTNTPVEPKIDILKLYFKSTYTGIRQSVRRTGEQNADGSWTIHYTVTLYPVALRIFYADTAGDAANHAVCGIPFMENDRNSTITICYIDKKEIYSIAELAAQYDVEEPRP